MSGVSADVSSVLMWRVTSLPLYFEVQGGFSGESQLGDGGGDSVLEGLDVGVLG